MRLPFLLFFLVLALPVDADNLPKADATFEQLDMSEVKLGQLLFYDPILSGNKSVSCATCHHPRFGTSDGVSLGIGDGGMGLGPKRVLDPSNKPEQRIPRNAPALFNLGASEFTVLFHDGRLEADPNEPFGFRTPLGEDMEPGFDNVLSAQTMFPVLSPDEMAGHYAENEIAQAIRQGFFTGPKGAWSLLTKRVAEIPEYSTEFTKIIGPDASLHFSDISNAIAAFMAFEWRADNSRFDQFLKSGKPLEKLQETGMRLFYGKAGCADCHSGQFQTDHGFHSIALPQIGPGKAARFESHQRDEGRMRVTGQSSDAYKFRTPSLRNVLFTAPYGHNGAYSQLTDIIKHHASPRHNLQHYRVNQALLPKLKVVNDFSILEDPNQLAEIGNSISYSPVQLIDEEIDAIVSFLGSLTDETSIAGRLGIPSSVPSGLPIDR